MRPRHHPLILALLLAIPAAQAQQAPLISLGGGEFDETALNPGVGYFRISKTDRHDPAGDFRAEYRFGDDLIPLPYGHLRPMLGLEATSRGQLYGASALMLDLPLGPLVFTPSIGPGLYARDSGKNLGSVLEFRTQFELAWQFADQSRLSVALSHISNAGVARTNPGADSLMLYYQIPATQLFQ